MVSYIRFLLFLIVPQLIYSITVSPESNLKNATKSKLTHNFNSNDKNNIKSIKLNSDKTGNSTKSISLADRNRRLIPYMTFYIPTDNENYDAINQQYNSPSHINQHQENSHQSNYPIYQQHEQRSELLKQESFVQQQPHHNQQEQSHQQHSQTAYLTDEHPLNEPIYIHMRLNNRPYPINGFQSSSTPSPLLYDNPRQTLNLLAKDVVDQPQYQQYHHHQLAHQQQNHQLPLKYQNQDPNNESYLPSSEITDKYRLQHSHHQSVPQQQTQQQNQPLPSSNPILHQHPDQKQPQSVPVKLYSSPFTPFNKIPGQFTPILFINNAPEKTYNYNYETPSSTLSTPTVATTAVSINHDNNENDSSNGNNESNGSIQPIPTDENHSEYLKLYKLKLLKQQQMQHVQHHPQQQPAIHKYPIEYSNHQTGEVNEQYGPYYYHQTHPQLNEKQQEQHQHHNHHQQQQHEQQHQQHQQHQQQHQHQHQQQHQHHLHNYHSYTNANNHHLNKDEHIVALVPVQQTYNSLYKKPQEEQQEHQQQIHHPTSVSHVHNIISTTQRPTYKLVTEISQKYNSHKQSQPTAQPFVVSTTESHMTPQQRYVAYLQQQLRQKYPNRYKDYQQSKVQPHHKEPDSYSNVQIDPYLVNASPSPNPPENHLYPEIQKQQPKYPKYVYPIKVETQGNNNGKNIVYLRPQNNIIKDNRPQIQAAPQSNYLQLVEVQVPEDQNGHQQQNNKGYMSVLPQLHPTSKPQTILIPVKQEVPQQNLHHTNHHSQKDNKMKPLFFLTTATPILVTSAGSVYKYEPAQRLKPIHMIPNYSIPPPTSTITTTPSPSHPSLKPSSPTFTNSLASIHSNNSSLQFGQKNRYNVQPTQYNSHKSQTFLIKPTYSSKPEIDEKPQQPLQEHYQSNKVPLQQSQQPYLNSFKSYSQLGHYQNSHNNEHDQQGHEKPPKITYREYYPPQIKPVLKLKPLQKIQNTKQEQEEISSPIIVPTTRLHPSSTPPTVHEPIVKPYQPSIQSTSYHENPIENEQRPEVLNQKLPNFKDTASLAEILRKLQETNHLPQTITPDNIDNSIKTLIKILNNLKESQTIVENPPQHHEPDYNDYDDDTPVENADPSKPGPNSGRPGIDYPNLAEIPPTSFNCKEQRYKGFFGDPETNCQVWHYCDLNGGQASFLCPNGTIFSQVALTCDWWFNVKCSSTAQLYVLNERLYKYILPFTPKFPEDYSGPLVDKYLALKFKEMEEKMIKEKQNESKEDENDETSLNKSNTEEETVEENDTDENINDKQQTTKSNESESPEGDSSNSQTIEEDNHNPNEEKSVNLLDVEENRGAVDTGITYNEYNPIISSSISTTTTPYPLPPSSQPAPPPLTVKPIYVPSTTASTPTIYSSTYVAASSNSIPSSTTATSSSTAYNNLISDLKFKHQNRLRIRQRFKLNRHHPDNNRKPKVDVESEKVEVIEIKTDGSSGHIIPNLQLQQQQPQQQTDYLYPE